MLAEPVSVGDGDGAVRPKEEARQVGARQRELAEADDPRDQEGHALIAQRPFVGLEDSWGISLHRCNVLCI